MPTPQEDVARWDSVLAALAQTCAATGTFAWLVGGCLRDALLGRSFADADVVVAGDPRALAEALRARVPLAVAPLKRGTVRLILNDRAGSHPLQLDLAPLRGGSIAADLEQRDFRCNALALPVADHPQLLALIGLPEASLAERAKMLPSLFDPLEGVSDLMAGALRVASEGAFRDEPGRVVRGARLVAAFGFAPATETLALARKSAAAVAVLPAERLRDELGALLILPRCAAGLAFLAEVGALGALAHPLAAPAAVYHAVASIRATWPLQVPADVATDDARLAPLADVPGLHEWYAAPLVGSQPRIAALRLGILAHAPHDRVGRRAGARSQVASSALFAHLSAPVRLVATAVWRECATWSVVLARREPSLVELRLLAARAGDALVDVLTAAAACAAAQAKEAPAAGRIAVRAGASIARFFTDRVSIVPPPLLDGRTVLRDLGPLPGPEVGRILRDVRAAQLRDEVRTHDDALALARRLRG